MHRRGILSSLRTNPQTIKIMPDKFKDAVEKRILVIGKKPEGVKVEGDPAVASMILRHEKFSPKAYSDFKQTSIGYGTKAKEGETVIDEKEARKRAVARITDDRNVVLGAMKKWGYNWTPSQVDALTSFRYNIGNIGEVTGNGKRSDSEIAESILLYNKTTKDGVTSPVEGLTKRRTEEANLFKTGMKHKIGVEIVRGK